MYLNHKNNNVLFGEGRKKLFLHRDRSIVDINISHLVILKRSYLLVVEAPPFVISKTSNGKYLVRKGRYKLVLSTTNLSSRMWAM